jgi:predicted outer membrane protein
MRSAVPSARAAGTLLVVLGLVATLAALLVPVYFFDGNRSSAISRNGWEDDGQGTWKTEYGPLTSLDRDFLRRVRAAGLWELPAGRVARERSERTSVRTVGDHLVEGDGELDKRVIQAGRTLRVQLPNRPTHDEQKYLEDIEKAEGDTFDEVFVNHLRKQNGGAFGLVGLVRDQTRNSMVRSLATRANTIVLDHIAVLEETGLVDYDALIQVQ